VLEEVGDAHADHVDKDRRQFFARFGGRVVGGGDCARNDFGGPGFEASRRKASNDSHTMNYYQQFGRDYTLDVPARVRPDGSSRRRRHHRP